jgi:hypothetical protein
MHPFSTWAIDQLGALETNQLSAPWSQRLSDRHTRGLEAIDTLDDAIDSWWRAQFELLQSPGSQQALDAERSVALKYGYIPDVCIGVLRNAATRNPAGYDWIVDVFPRMYAGTDIAGNAEAFSRCKKRDNARLLLSWSRHHPALGTFISVLDQGKNAELPPKFAVFEPLAREVKRIHRLATE